MSNSLQKHKEEAHTHVPRSQLFLSQSEHPHVRARCVAHLRQRREDFEPFLDETEPWDRYLENMSKLQTWGGELEIQALSQLFEYANMVIYVACHGGGDTQSRDRFIMPVQGRLCAVPGQCGDHPSDFQRAKEGGAAVLHRRQPLRQCLFATVARLGRPLPRYSLAAHIQHSRYGL